MRRVGIVYLTLLGVGIVGALLVAPRVEDPAAVVAALLPTLAGAYLAWSAYRADRLEAAAVTEPGAVADRLAAAVRRQWEAEARVRRLADPYPLPVGWRGADTDLAEVTAGLGGRDGEIGAVFTQRVSGRRLLVLGDPGSGKTLLLVRLVLALIEARAAGGPVPVLFPLVSWDPAAVDLRGWMERKLVQDYAELGVAAPGEYGEATLAGMLLDRRLVLPVLDGFDELPADMGGLALHRIGEALPYGCGLVLSSRPAEYRAALRPRTGVPARLTGMAGIRLEPLGADDVAAYLLRDAGGSGTPAAARWEAVVPELGTQAPVAAALSNPLMVSLARSVYNPRPGETEGVLPDPADLLRCPTRTAVERHLLDAFIATVYRPGPIRPCRWTVDEARSALRFLARHMERGVDGAAEVAWWKLHDAVPRLVPRLLAGVLLGALAWLAEGAVLEVVFRFTHNSLYAPHWEYSGVLGALAGCLGGGLVGGLAAGATVTALCAGAGGFTAGLVLAWLGHGGSLTLAGLVCCGLALGRRPVLRPPPAWDRGVLLTGIATAALYAVAFRNACGFVSTFLLTVMAGAVGADGPARAHCPVAKIRWSVTRRGVALGLVAGALLSSFWWVERVFADALGGEPGRYFAGPSDALEAAVQAWEEGTLFAVVCILLHGLRPVPVDLAGSGDAAALLRNDRRTLTTCVLTATVLGAVLFGAWDWCMSAAALLSWKWRSTLDYGWLCLVNLIPALLIGGAAGLRQTAWPRYALARSYLALRTQLPCDLMAFLADAHEHRGVLRRTGAVYQFRHIELQHRLADADADP